MNSPGLAVLFAISVTVGIVRPVDAQPVSSIESDDEVILFPVDATLSEDEQTWNAQLHGWVFQRETDDVFRRRVLDLIKLPPSVVDLASQQRCETRLRPFLCDNERREQIVVRLGTKAFELDPSDADGHFGGNIEFDADAARRLRDGAGWLIVDVAVPDSHPRQYQGRIRLLPSEGATVISDIDDTVKVTQVTDRLELIANTFYREFCAVEEMADAYRQWHQSGAQVVFVSASPWQLYEPLSDFFQAKRFPPAVFHLRRVRFKSGDLAQLLTSSQDWKVQTIRGIITRSHRRRYVLIGDSGERDPEIYGQVAREFPDRVQRIWIRQVTPEGRDAERYRMAFERLSPEIWSLFSSGSDLLKIAKSL